MSVLSVNRLKTCPTVRVLFKGRESDGSYVLSAKDFDEAKHVKVEDPVPSSPPASEGTVVESTPEQNQGSTPPAPTTPGVLASPEAWDAANVDVCGSAIGKIARVEDALAILEHEQGHKGRKTLTSALAARIASLQKATAAKRVEVEVVNH